MSRLSLAVRRTPIDSLEPYARNARTHSDEQVAQIAASLVEFGWTNPILVDDQGGVIAGHGRLLAARNVAAAGGSIPNWPDTDAVPTIALGHLTQAQRRAYVIADNQLATRAGWDEEILAAELVALGDFDLSLLGFDEQVLSGLLRGHSPDGDAAEPETKRAAFTYQEKFAVLVECAGEAEQAQTFDKLQGMGYSVKVLVN